MVQTLRLITLPSLVALASKGVKRSTCVNPKVSVKGKRTTRQVGVIFFFSLFGEAQPTTKNERKETRSHVGQCGSANGELSIPRLRWESFLCLTTSNTLWYLHRPHPHYGWINRIKSHANQNKNPHLTERCVNWSCSFKFISHWRNQEKRGPQTLRTKRIVMCLRKLYYL